jgi:Protein of unknown function (DUF3710)
VSLFKRGKGPKGDPDDLEGTSEQSEQTGQTDEDVADADAEESAAEEAAPVVGERTAAARAAAQLRANGPFDVAEVDDLSELIDLGAILVPPVEGMELRLELNEEDGEHVVGVTVLLADSAVQVQAFAAPRSEGIWDEVRTEIASGITQQGGTADEADGAFGRELLTRVPGPGPDGKPGFQPARFLGIDGPRWFLRAVLSGAAVDQAKAGPVEALVRSLVVVRGAEAMAPRELLSLRIPTAPADAGEGAAEAEDDGDGEGGPGYADDLNPFERGPEITEIR